MASPLVSGRIPFLRPVAVAAGVLAGAAFAAPAAAVNNEPPQCLSPNPALWPAPAKPYFMLALDTSNASNLAFPPAPALPVPPAACPTYPANVNGHERCAVQQAVQAFGGQVNFGLAGFALTQQNCNAACFVNCTYAPYPGDPFFGGNPAKQGCGPGAGLTRQGANILVPMQQDNFWAGPPSASNVPQILQYVDNDCTGSTEMWGAGRAALNGSLEDMYRYYGNTYVIPGTATAIPSPLDPTNERACRSVNVILVAAGFDDCDTNAFAVTAATNLYNGVTVGNFTWSIRTHVIALSVASQASAQAIAGTGATANQQGSDAGHGYFAFVSDSVGLSQAFANIIGSAIQPETCDNVDNNCNGCTDEGFTHYCDVGQACCALAPATCLANYQASITPQKPEGDATQLPCTSVAAGATPATWLCYNPGDVCDAVDNNCNGVVDEGAVKCGSPAHCPQAEVCNGQDDDCNGIVDDAPGGGSVCPNNCVPSPENCDGCDNDCNGLIDDNVASGSCGLPANPPVTPAYCAGVLTCTPVAGMVPPGTCNGSGGKLVCSAGSQPEICDGVDNDCNGIVDDGVASTPCVPVGTPPSLVYGGTSQCKKGQTQCMNGATICVGFVGPSAEVCDGVDNDCNGAVDDGVPGTNQSCGNTLGACKPGKTACVNGALVCSGGVGPSPETCDGVDNDCNGQVDDGMLTGAPAAGMDGCWDLPGNCCVYVDPQTSKTTSWCPPAGATCTTLGALVAPQCAAGALACSGGGWVCKGSKDPSPEICDGKDNNCNGQIDDGVLPSPVGLPCGSSVGECQPGVNVCVNGMVTCNGVGPTKEVCDGKDNDCNGLVDDNIQGLGMPCDVVYDMSLYPGVRTFPPCHQGINQCDGMGNLKCVGGVGPSPEICDGIDNDCDGAIDEVGATPDGINGTANPVPPVASIGDACGGTVGECKPGTWACAAGHFVCGGGVAPQPEACDCKDNDCDGTIDNANDGGTPPLCGGGKDCVQSSFGCQCAAPCQNGEFPCPGGQICKEVMLGGMTVPTHYCVMDACGGDCSSKKTIGPGNKIICAPSGTAPDPTTCLTPPQCVCSGQNGCQNPCNGVSCATGGLVCTDYGPNAGKCVANTCFNTPCAGCGKVCNAGVCQDDPCKADSCKPDQECKPSPDFMSPVCVTPCAAVACSAAEACVDGKCVPTCTPACDAGQTCDLTQSPPACVADKCQPSPCTDSSCCNPLTGACGSCPCEGVLCPSGDICQNGQCVNGGGTTSSSASSSAAASSSSSAGGGGAGGSSGVWGLATGGGGCVCEIGPVASPLANARWALLALAIALGRQRRKTRSTRRAGGPEVSR